MLLYQPTTNEITIAAARLRHRLPELCKRIDKAVPILQQIDLNFCCEDSHWQLRSQSRATWFTVSETACECEDYQRHCDDAEPYYCKHRLAYHGYRHLLIVQLLNRSIGNFRFTNERKLAQAAPGSILHLTDSRPRAIAYSPSHKFPRHICYLRLDPLDRLVPQRLRDFVSLAEWLTTAPSFTSRQPLPKMEDFGEPSGPDRQPEWKHIDFQHWIQTGDTPAMRARY